jgi:predicted aspartyl protease
MGYNNNRFKILGVVAIAVGASGCGALVNNIINAPPGSTDAATDLASESAPAEPSQPTLTPPPTSVEALVSSTPNQDTPPQRDYFQEGINRASSAVAIGQSAQSQDDWSLAVSRWQQAVNLLKQVPDTSTDYNQAQAKIQEYRTHLAAAQGRAAEQPEPSQPASTLPERPDGLVAQIPIQDRRGGTPVVAVTMKGQKSTSTFPMLFDTGATGTLITQEMADALGVAVVDQTQARIADGSVVTLPIGYITAIEVGGLRKEGVLVAIGGSVGLLGQDFYGEYGIAMGSQVINLHQ